MLNKDTANAMQNRANSIDSITIVADSNIASLDAFFNASMLGQVPEQTVKIITVTGRDINAQLLAEVEPDVLLIRSVTPVGEALLANNNSVKFVGSATIGTDHVDQDVFGGAKYHFRQCGWM